MMKLSGGTQTAQRVFEQIGLTSLNPEHPDRLRGSCHQKTALVIHKNREQLKDSDQVILLGVGKTVFHSIIVREGECIYDSDPNGIYDGNTQAYNPENWENSHFKELIYPIAIKSIGEIQGNEKIKAMAQSPYSSANTRKPSGPRPR